MNKKHEYVIVDDLKDYPMDEDTKQKYYNWFYYHFSHNLTSSCSLR